MSGFGGEAEVTEEVLAACYKPLNWARTSQLGFGGFSCVGFCDEILLAVGVSDGKAARNLVKLTLFRQLCEGCSFARSCLCY